MTFAWIGFAVYAVVWIVMGCRVGTALAWYFLRGAQRRYTFLFQDQTEPNGGQWLGAVLTGLLVAAVWPLLLVVLAFRGFLFRPPQAERLRQQKERIAELEEELNIR